MTASELIAIVGVTFSIAVVIALKLARPTVINNYAPKAEAYADSGGAAGPSGSILGALVKIGMLGVALTVALAIISAVTNIATSATDAISEAARPAVQAPVSAPVQMPVPATIEAPAPPPVQVPVPAPVPVAQPGLGDLFTDFLAAGGWIPFALIIALVLTRPRGQRAANQSPTVYYPPRQDGGRGIPVEDVPLFAGSREKSRK